MRCLLRFFASVIWRKTSNGSTDCDTKRIGNETELHGLRIRKTGKVVLLTINCILYSFIPIPLLAADVPAIPGSVDASDGTFLDIVRLTWANVADETDYQVFRCATTDTGTCGDAIATPSADTTQYDDINVLNIGGKHYYRLKSCNVTGCTDFSSADIGYTQLISGNGYEDDAVAIRSFTVNGTSQVTLLTPPDGPVVLDWSTRSAENCKASSTPVLDDWNTSVSISTYGPISVHLPAIANSYSLELSCYSTSGLEVRKYVTVTVGSEPEAPTLTSATADDENVELTFTPNGDGGSAITGYTANCGAITQNGPSSPITLIGLSNGVEYSCSVIATNELGDSETSNAILVTPKTTPEAPTLISATAGDTNAVLTFTANDNGGSAITGYTAKCAAITQNGPSSPITVIGLTNGVEYSCSVFATNEVGDSAPSNVILVTPISLVQASITKFEVTTNKDPQPVSCGDTNIAFEWEATNADKCYGSWAESESNQDGSLLGSIDQQTGALYDTESVLFEDLALTKKFTLRCENDNGETSQEESVSVKAPCLTTITKSWIDVFTREWPAPITYRTDARITGDRAWAIKFNTGPVVSQTSTSSPITVTGMQRGARYSCSVVANNASGSSSPSNFLYFNPVEMVPEAPTLVSATAGDRSAQLTFTARGDLFVTTGYQAKCGSISRTGSSSPITVSNLSNDTDYFCSVTARNELGIGERSNQIAVSPQAPSLFVTSVKGGGGVFQASPATPNPNISATVPSAPTLISYELGHLSAELTVTDDSPDASSYTASCRISTAGGVGTIEFGSTRGSRLLAISHLPGDFQVAEECKDTQSLDGFLIWNTEGSEYDGTACELEPNKDYYWNLTFTDGINAGTSSCAGTPCQTYIRVVNPDTVN